MRRPASTWACATCGRRRHARRGPRSLVSPSPILLLWRRELRSTHGMSTLSPPELTARLSTHRGCAPRATTSTSTTRIATAASGATGSRCRHSRTPRGPLRNASPSPRPRWSLKRSRRRRQPRARRCRHQPRARRCRHQPRARRCRHGPDARRAPRTRGPPPSRA